MTIDDIFNALEQKFGPAIKGKTLEAVDPFIWVDPLAFLEICKFLRDDERFRFDLLNNISGVDYLELDPKKAPKAGFQPHMEVVYHLQSFTKRFADGRPLRLTLKVLLPRWKDDQPNQLPEVDSVTSVWRSADWHEREVYDLCGVHFIGHPNLTRILLAEDWVGHPLRKDYEFPLEYHGIRGR